MYKQRTLRFEFFNETQAFDKEGNNKISIANIKAMLKYGSHGNITGSTAEITLYGLSLDLLAALSSKGIGVYTAQTERIRVKAYVEDTEVYTGFVFSSYANMNSSPESALIINVASSSGLKDKPASPFSRPGDVKLTEVLRAICEPYKYRLNPVGIDGITTKNIHLEGDPLRQIRDACDQFELSMTINGDQVTVWPKGTAVDDIIPLVSPDHGLIGYPVYSEGGIMFQTEYSSLLSQGRFVNLQTSLPHASGKYMINVAEHYLSSWMEGGPWHTLCQANKYVGEVKNG